MSEVDTLFYPVRLWRRYRSLPLSEQFKWEWIAFSIIATWWTGFCVGWAVFG